MSRTRAWARPVVIAVLVAVALINIGCSSSDTTTTSTSTSSAGSTATAAPSLATTTPTSAAAGALSGTWSGEYQQTAPTTSSGTFTLTWQQSGSDLSGSIKVMGGGDFTSNITGKLEGGSIRFGSLGQGAITYTGSVSGNTMSGTYQDAVATSKGTWKATKTS